MTKKTIAIFLLCTAALLMGAEFFIVEKEEGETSVPWTATIRRKLHRVRRPIRVEMPRPRPGVVRVSRPEESMYRSTPERNVVETIQSYPELSGVVNLLSTQPANGNSFQVLLEQLQGEGPCTIFAPTDAAWGKFAREYPQLLEDLKDSVEEGSGLSLLVVLLYHMLDDQALITFGSSWRSGGPFETKYRTTELNLATLEATTVAVTTVETSRYRAGQTGPLVAKVNDARVIDANIMASNGVIHIIDTVLLPNS